MIWRRLKKATREQEEEFSERMSDETVSRKERARDHFAMIASAFLVIVLPCLLVLVGFALLILLLFGAL